MQKIFKRFLSVMLSLFLFLTTVIAINAGAVNGDTALRVSLENISAEKGDTVIMPVASPDNPGIAAFAFEILYDENILTLQSISGKNAGTYGVLFEVGSDVTANPDKNLVAWASAANAETNGIIFWLTFKINADTPDGSESEVSIRLKDDTPESLKNEDGNNVALNVTPGRIIVGAKSGSSAVTAPDKEIPAAVTEEVSPAAAADANTAVEILAREKAAASGAIIKAAGAVVTAKTEASRSVPVTLTLPSSSESLSTMAILNSDGTLTPVPTKINTDGTVTVFINGEVTLVPLSVSAEFNDTLNHWGASEIKRAASLMIVEGIGDGKFSPDAMVTNAEAVTMFMRAFSIPPETNAVNANGIDQSKWYASIMNTAIERGLTGLGTNPDAPMSRIETAGLIFNSLSEIGANYTVTSDEADILLAEFNDLASLSPVQREQLAICVKLGIFKGGGDGFMSPYGQLQRAQTAALAVRIQDIILTDNR